MDYRKLGLYVMVLGIVILVVAGLVFLNNQPLESGDGISAIIKDIFNYSENARREAARSNAQYVIGAGVIIAFFGFAVLKSSKD